MAPSSIPARAFSDDFEHAGADGALAPPWLLRGGSFRVVPVDGGHALSTIGDHNLPLWLDVPLARNVRVEFTSRSRSPSVDMKMEIFGDGLNHQSGYIVVVGGWNNSLSVLARLDEHEPHRIEKRTRWESNRSYRWRVQRTDGHTVELYIDDVLLLAYADATPLAGPRHDRMAFSAWESTVEFDDLVVTPLPD